MRLVAGETAGAPLDVVGERAVPALLVCGRRRIVVAGETEALAERLQADAVAEVRAEAGVAGRLFERRVLHVAGEELGDRAAVR